MKSALKTLREVNTQGKRVLVRVDFNVPLDKKNGEVQDMARLEATLPTIQHLIQEGAKVILLSHLGRPDPKNPIEELKLNRVAEAFSQCLGKPIKKLDQCIGGDVKKAIEQMHEGDVILLENTRFYEGEESNEETFSKSLAELGDLFVSDAFGTVHRAHSSTVGIAKFLPAYAGFLVEKEIKMLNELIENPQKPLVLLVGGAKIDTKIGVLENFFGKADAILVGGGLAPTFLYALGHEVGLSLCEKDKKEVANSILDEAKAHHVQFLIPEDVVVSETISESATTQNVSVDEVRPKDRILDIGPDSIEQYKKVLREAKTIVWNGPMGLYEFKPFSNGTQEMIKAISESKATTIIGGGDSIDAIRRFGYSLDQFTHVSTGGGAMLEFLEGKELPGIAVLRSKS